MNASSPLSYNNIIDADGHILEPPDVWEKYIDPKYRDRALRIRVGNDGHEYLELDGKPSKFFNIKAFTLLGGMGRSAEEIAAAMQKTYVEAAPFGSMDPKERLKLMDQEGMAAALMYPSVGLTWECELEDPELAMAYCRAYNRWIVDFCSDSNGRLVPIAHLALSDGHAAAAELERSVKSGCKGAFVAPFTITNKAHAHPDYDPFWAAAQDLRLPLSLHILTERRGGGLGGRRRLLTSYIAVPHGVQKQLAVMIFGGVLERFPNLQLVSAENDVSWMPHFMYRLDHAYDRFRHFEGVTLPLLPSDYVKRQVYATFQFETVGKDLVEAYGADKMMWSSDYPHTDSPWPHSREYIEGAAFKRISPEETQKIVAGNAARLYQIALS